MGRDNLHTSDEELSKPERNSMSLYYFIILSRVSIVPTSLTNKGSIKYQDRF